MKLELRYVLGWKDETVPTGCVEWRVECYTYKFRLSPFMLTHAARFWHRKTYRWRDNN
jgi:hypothetical protein